MAMTSGPQPRPKSGFFDKNMYKKRKKKVSKPSSYPQNVISHRTMNNTAPRDIPYSPPIRKTIAQKVRGEFGRSLVRGKQVVKHTAKVLKPAAKVAWPVAKAFYHLASDNPPAFVRDVVQTAGAIPGAAWNMGRNFYQDMVRDMHFLKTKYKELYPEHTGTGRSYKRVIHSKARKLGRVMKLLPKKHGLKRHIIEETYDKRKRLNDSYPEVEVIEESDIELCVC